MQNVGFPYLNPTYYRFLSLDGEGTLKLLVKLFPVSGYKLRLTGRTLDANGGESAMGSFKNVTPVRVMCFFPALRMRKASVRG